MSGEAIESWWQPSEERRQRQQRRDRPIVKSLKRLRKVLMKKAIDAIEDTKSRRWFNPKMS